MNVQTKSNREVIAALYEHFTIGHHESIAAGKTPTLDMFNAQTVWIEPCGNLRSGTFRGVDEMLAHTANCIAMTDGTWGTDALEILDGDKYVVVIERVLALRNGTSLNTLCSSVYEMSDGIITEVRVLPFDAETWNAFWS